MAKIRKIIVGQYYQYKHGAYDAANLPDHAVGKTFRVIRGLPDGLTEEMSDAVIQEVHFLYNEFPDVKKLRVDQVGKQIARIIAVY